MAASDDCYHELTHTVSDCLQDKNGFTEWVNVSAISVTTRTIISEPIFKNEIGKDKRLTISKISSPNLFSAYLFSGEMLSEWKPLFSKVLDKRAPYFLTGYAAGDCLYIPPESEIHRGGYEVDGFQRPFKLKGVFDPMIDATITSSIKNLSVKN